MMAAPIQVQSLDHVTLVVKDLDRSRTFYVEALGMTEVPRPNFAFPGLWFQAGPTQIHLIGEHLGTPPAGNPLPEQFRTSRSHHFAFLVNDADGLYTVLSFKHGFSCVCIFYLVTLKSQQAA